MALPTSGPLSMNAINVEVGRAGNTANTLLAGGSTPTAGSLFGLANSTINKVAPHSISEFYGYSNTVTNYTLTIYGRNAGGTVGNVQYTINGGSRVTLGSILSLTCGSKGTITAASGSTVRIYISDGSDAQFNYTNGSTTCPTFSLGSAVSVLTITVASSNTYALTSNLGI